MRGFTHYESEYGKRAEALAVREGAAPAYTPSLTVGLAATAAPLPQSVFFLGVTASQTAMWSATAFLHPLFSLGGALLA